MALGNKLAITALIISVLAYYIYSFLEHNGAFRPITPLNTETCTRTKQGGLGMEDLVVNKAGYAFVSNDDRRWFHGLYATMANMTADEQSDIWVYNLNIPFKKRQLNKLKINNIPYTSEPQRHYHGIYLRQSTTGHDYLYAVTHTLKGEAIYIMRVNYKSEKTKTEPLSLDLVGIIRDPHESHADKKLFRALNDLAVVSSGGTDERHVMFVTNWIGVGQDSKWAELETLTRRPWGYVLKVVATHTGNCIDCWSVEASKAIEGLMSPNGIELSLDQQQLITVESGGKRVLYYNVTGEDVSPKPYMVQQEHSHHDNIVVDQHTGDLYIGSHPAGLKYVKHKDSPNHTVPAPSEVIKIPYVNGQFGIPESVLMSFGNDNDGKHISASTTALKWKNEVIVGSVFEKGLMVCENVPF